MYFPVGWPKILALPASVTDQDVLKVSFDREKILFSVLTRTSIGIWFNNVRDLISLCTLLTHSPRPFTCSPVCPSCTAPEKMRACRDMARTALRTGSRTRRCWS